MFDSFFQIENLLFFPQQSSVPQPLHVVCAKCRATLLGQQHLHDL